jgi:hypothetical protein
MDSLRNRIILEKLATRLAGAHKGMEKEAKKKDTGARTELGLVLGGAGAGGLVHAREKAELSRWLKKNKPGHLRSPAFLKAMRRKALLRPVQGAITGSALASILWGIKQHKERGGTKSKTAAFGVGLNLGRALAGSMRGGRATSNRGINNG